MGTWSARLFSNDTTCDVKDTYMEYLKKQLSDEEAFQKTYEEYEELIGTDEEPLFWYAMADTQWSVGRLMLDVRDKAMKYIQIEGGIELWEEVSGGAAKWRSTLQKLEDKLNTPMPPRKRIPKPIEFVRNPWNLGDVYAYQFHTKKAEEHGMYGKYILFQKVGDVEYYNDCFFSVVQVFDRAYDNIPNVDMLKDVRVLPMVCAERDKNIRDYFRPFEYYMKVILEYYQIRDYPKKHLTYIGNINVPEVNYDYKHFDEYCWRKNEMENWLIDFYLSWQGVEY